MRECVLTPMHSQYSTFSYVQAYVEAVGSTCSGNDAVTQSAVGRILLMLRFLLL